MERTPLVGEVELQVREQHFSKRQYSYELTQKLTYFVISAELVFCGYMLLNVDKLVGVKGVSYLFAVCGAAAFFGILWRFCYNQTYHDQAHGVQSPTLYMVTCRLQTVSYQIYVVLSIVTFVWGLVAGFDYLYKFKGPSKDAELTPSAVSAPAVESRSTSGKATIQEPQEDSSKGDSLKNPSTGPTPKVAPTGDVKR